ncbi:hypothetical protein B0H63DRAFT_505615 [Podospora didyma]|uniref:Uncharacterized protein n=1 Tax=Podospora didyma TaxID=330526 RepID=A0AAE0P5P4_9PEZI|nr:hypothetical protein B0H63DRAFT_505615 [Podospora didyma]
MDGDRCQASSVKRSERSPSNGSRTHYAAESTSRAGLPGQAARGKRRDDLCGIRVLVYILGDGERGEDAVLHDFLRFHHGTCDYDMASRLSPDGSTSYPSLRVRKTDESGSLVATTDTTVVLHKSRRWNTTVEVPGSTRSGSTRTGKEGPSIPLWQGESVNVGVLLPRCVPRDRDASRRRGRRGSDIVGNVGDFVEYKRLQHSDLKVATWKPSQD